MSWLRNLGLKWNVYFSVILACLVCSVVALVVSIYYSQKEFTNGLVEKSRLLHGRLDIAAKYVATQGGLAPMIERYKSQYQSSDQLTEEDKLTILKQVPIYAAMQLGSQHSKEEHYTFRVFSNEPRNKNNMATEEEMQIFRKFEADANLKELVDDDSEKVTVYRPVRLQASHGCMNCHGDPQKSPWGNGKDILGIPMENWTDGKLHGVFAIISDKNEVHAAQAAAGYVSPIRNMSLLIFLSSIAAVLIAAFLMKRPIASLQSIIEALNQGSNEVSAASGQIATSAQGLSESSTTQATSLEETVATVEELTAMVKQNSDNAHQAATLSEQAAKTADRGEQEIRSLVVAINEISHDSKKIKDITNVIDDIAFQTNLLALNAAVEAARAGEQGKGFAVVAEAVRNLAQRSAQATKDIADLIQNSVEKIEKGTEQANRGGEVLAEIVGSVRKVSELNKEISLANEEQAKGITQISQTLSGLDEITQRNAAAAEESAAASEEMAAQSSSMKQNVDGLALVVGGAGAKTNKPGKFQRAA